MQHHAEALQYFILRVRTQYFWECVTTKTHKQSRVQALFEFTPVILLNEFRLVILFLLLRWDNSL